jgi:hypothetical protein
MTFVLHFMKKDFYIYIEIASKRTTLSGESKNVLLSKSLTVCMNKYPTFDYIKLKNIEIELRHNGVPRSLNGGAYYQLGENTRTHAQQNVWVLDGMDVAGIEHHATFKGNVSRINGDS